MSPKQKKCKKCGQADIMFLPDPDVKIRGSGCLSVAIMLSGIPIIGVILIIWLGVRYFNIVASIGVILLFITIISKIHEKPAGTATCQDCGNQWKIDKNGNPYRSYAFVKVVASIAFIIAFLSIIQSDGFKEWLDNFVQNTF